MASLFIVRPTKSEEGVQEIGPNNFKLIEEQRLSKGERKANVDILLVSCTINLLEPNRDLSFKLFQNLSLDLDEILFQFNDK